MYDIGNRDVENKPAYVVVAEHLFMLFSNTSFCVARNALRMSRSDLKSFFSSTDQLLSYGMAPLRRRHGSQE